jgi:ubiquinone/menaquinone biosynthesis C-methylase UbiE
MVNQLNLNQYKQEIADLYSHRSYNYDAIDWHHQIAHRLVEYAQISQGQHLLDIATGTGMVALEAAQIVGSTGWVVGVDISSGMLEQARRKAEELSLNNIEFQLADAEALNFPANSFDCVLCSSALIWMTDLSAALRLWGQLLKPNGLIGFHAFADTAFVEGVVMQQVAQKYGISLNFNQPTSTEKKCYNLLQAAGFKAIEVKVEKDGTYISLEKVKAMWARSFQPTPGQFPNPLSQVSAEQLAQIKDEFDAELEKLQTEQGIWNDLTTFYVFGRKLA